MAAQNPWIGYVERSYEQMKNSIISKFPDEVPELTDHTENDLFVVMVSIWSGIAEMLGYYIDIAAREIFLSTSRYYTSAVKIAKLFNYRIRGVKPSLTRLRFSLDTLSTNDVIIPVNTQVDSLDGISFYTNAQLTIPAGELFGEVDSIQSEQRDEFVLGNSDGRPNQEFELELNVVDGSVIIFIDAVQYQFVENLAFSDSEDKVFTTSLNTTGKMIVKFGDGVNGFIPETGTIINVRYNLSTGSNGNIAENSIQTIVGDIPVPGQESLSVTNVVRASGGKDIENLEELQNNIPLSIRTLNRAVTEQDHIDIATLNQGVAKAFVDFECGSNVRVYIVPEGGGLATDSLLQDVREDFYDETKMVLIDIDFVPAGEIRIILDINVNVLPVYNRGTVEALVRQNLIDFLNTDNQEISGTVHLGDIYQVVENTTGVDNSIVNLLTFVPNARSIVGNSILQWNRVLKERSSITVRWRILFGGSNEYQLFSDNIFVGRFTIGQSVSRREIDFTVLPGDYNVGDVWEFITYPYNKTVELSEPSIPTLYNENLTLNVSGGI